MQAAFSFWTLWRHPVAKARPPGSVGLPILLALVLACSHHIVGEEAPVPGPPASPAEGAPPRSATTLPSDGPTGTTATPASPEAPSETGAATAPSTPPWAAAEPQVEMIRALIDSRTKELEAIPADAAPDSNDGRRRAALTRRVELLGDLVSVLGEKEKLRSSGASIEEEQRKLDEEAARLKSLSPPTPPSNPTTERFEALKSELADLRAQEKSLSARVTERKQRVASIPDEISKTTDLLNRAEDKAEKLTAEAASAPDQAERELRTLRAGNATIEASLAREELEFLEDEQSFEKSAIPYRDAQLDVLRMRIERKEKEFELYTEALASSQKAAQKEAERRLAQTKREASEALSGPAKDLKRLEVDIATVRANITRIQAFKTEVAGVSAELEKFLKAERDRLQLLETLMKHRYAAASEEAARILKTNFALVGKRRRALARIVQPELAEQLTAYRGRRFELDGMLYDFREHMQQQLDAVLAEVPVAEREGFVSRFTALQAEYRDVLSQEKSLLVDVTNEGNNLEFKPLEIAGVQDSIETFVLSHVFWLQDRSPLGLATIRKAAAEIRDPDRPSSLVNWWKIVVSADTTTPILENLQDPEALPLKLALLVVLLVPLLFVRGRLRRYVAAQNLASLQHSAGIATVTRTIAAGVAAAALLPGYVLVVSWTAESFPVPPAVGSVLAGGLRLLGAAFFLWLLNRLAFLPKGIAESHFRVGGEVTRTLYRVLNFILVGHVLFRIPSRLLAGTPFGFEAIPRVGNLAALSVYMVAILYTFRRSSPVIRAAIGDDRAGSGRRTGGFFARNWRVFFWALAILMVVIVLLEVRGYHFSAAFLARGGVLTVATMVVLLGCYRLVIPPVERLLARRRRVSASAPGEAPLQSRFQTELQVRRFIRVVFVLTGLFLVCVFWGINQQAIQALNEFTIYSITRSDGQQEFVSVASVLKALVSILLTIWILKNLPSIYELAVFPRMRLDAGLRYAFLTISRYTVFVVGLLITLHAIHLDLGRIGWLVAAISVGLGFGLQEIVANFVSGIILLVERPVRVGDTVTVGAISGTVTRINIRATTVVNWDRQEILVPNRQLITQEVTNWTLADTIIRLVIPIGVAYGSDVDKVREILLEVADEQPEALRDPPPQAFFLAHGESSLDFELRVFLSDTAMRLPLKDRINTLINKRLREAGVEIPFPQRDIHIRTAAESKKPGVTLSPEEAMVGEGTRIAPGEGTGN